MIQNLNPDIIALQEVDNGYRVSGNKQIQVLTELTGMHAYPGPTLHNHKGTFGNMILSKNIPYKIVHHNIHFYKNKKVEPRAVIETHYNHNDTDIAFFATHFGLSLKEKKYQMKELTRIVRQNTSLHQKVITAGDFNMLWPCSITLHKAKETLGMLHNVPSYPACCAILPLDKIFVTDSQSKLQRYKTDKSKQASDHLPIYIDL